MMGSGAKLFVGCLPYSRTEADLETLFGQFGQVLEVALMRGPQGNSKGAAFVTFADAACAASAVTYLQGYLFDGATRGINVSFATSSGPSKAASGVGGAQFASAATPAVAPAVAQAVIAQAMGRLQDPSPRDSYGGVVSPPGSKLFVGQLPFSRTEADLLQLFSAIGPVLEVCLLKDKKTQEKTGAAFVRYLTAQHAAAAAVTLNGFLFSGSTRPITVSIAQGSTMDSHQKKFVQPASGMAMFGETATPIPTSALPSEPGAKLFVGQLPFSKSEQDLEQLFGMYGPIAEVLLHRDAQGQKKGGAFVRFVMAADANSSLELDGYLFQGATRPITVSIASSRGPQEQAPAPAPAPRGQQNQQRANAQFPGAAKPSIAPTVSEGLAKKRRMA